MERLWDVILFFVIQIGVFYAKQKTSQIIKNIEVGKFYFIHDGSKTGHPGLIVWKDDKKNLYLAIKFRTTQNEHNICFKRPIGKKAKTSYMYRRSFLGKRKDYDKRISNDMWLDKEETEFLINNIDLTNPVFSKNINRKDKRFFKWIIKQK